MDALAKLLITPFFLILNIFAHAEETCVEPISNTNEPAQLQVTANEYWHYVLFETQCGQRKFLQVDYVVDHMPHSMVFELDDEEKAELESQGEIYLELLRKVASYNHEEFEQTRQIKNFNKWTSSREAIDNYIAEIIP